MKVVRVGQIGLGAWGSNLLRTFRALPGCRVVRVADSDPSKLATLPGAGRPPATGTDYREVIADREVDAVVIATPAETHARIGSEALAAGKHLFVEKPLALTSLEGRRLEAQARRRGLVLMVGHLLMYHPAIEAMAALVRRGRIGALRYLGIRRRAFGRLQAGCGVLWDLGPHDVSIALMVAGGRPLSVASRCQGVLRPAHPEICLTQIRFAGGALAHIEESWLAPDRERQLLAVGDRGMLLFDELAPAGDRLRHVERSVRVRPGGTSFLYRDRGSRPVAVPEAQPLAAECRDFLRCVRQRREPRAGGRSGVTVLRVLEAAAASQRDGGRERPLRGGRAA